MAKQAPPADTSETATSGIVTSDGARQRGIVGLVKGKLQALLQGRQWWLGGALIALVVLAAGVYVWQHRDSAKTGSTSNKQDESLNAPTESVANTVQDMVATGKFSDAQAVLDEQLAAAKDDATKGAVYEQKSSVANNADDFQNALNYAQQAETLNPTQTSAYLAAIAAESLGQNQLAVSYYQKALDRLTALQKKQAPDLAEGYNAKIKELSQ